jgi:uncharacterized protein YcnI
MASRTRTRHRVVGVVATAAIAVALIATPAGAHITVNPASAATGGFSIFSFAVPNERDTASTVGLEVQFPTAQVIPFVSVQPVPGWQIAVTKRTLDKPVKVHGSSITQVVERITWTGGRIDAGQFQLFTVSAGPLPTKAKQLVFKAIQTYGNGEVVRWIETATKGAPEPEHPAPVLKLTSASSDHGH